MNSLLKREENQSPIEYFLIILLVAIVIIAILVLLGPQIGSIFNKVT
ncbi:MAG: pilus assembly protein [bacterium]|nr:pilus assembly protein [bacterium]